MRGLNQTECPWVRTHISVIICQNKCLLLCRNLVSIVLTVSLLHSVWTADYTDKIKLVCLHSYIYHSYLWGCFRLPRMFVISHKQQCGSVSFFILWDETSVYM
jgi:hypothetical protein